MKKKKRLLMVLALWHYYNDDESLLTPRIHITVMHLNVVFLQLCMLIFIILY